MKHTLKKSIAVVLATLMLLSAAPLSGFVGLEWTDIDFPSFAFPEINLPDFDFNLSAGAATIVQSGSCGEKLTYTLDSDGVLTIAGTGKMTNYTSSSVPWYLNRSAINTVIIENGVTSIGKYAFYKCTSLTSVTIPDSVTSIGDSVFSWCTSLTSVTIPDSVTSIEEYAFYRCTSLTSVTIPDSVTSIGEYAFSDCTKLTSVTIGNSVTSIGERAFYICTKLTDITVDADNTTYCSEDGVLFNKSKTELIQYPIGNARTSYTIPDSVTSIGGDAFSNCTKLTSVTIPDSVTSIGWSAFFNCTKLTSVTIGAGVTSIGDSAFAYCRSLTSVTIPDSVTSIRDRAFYNCTKLTSVTIGAGVTSIGRLAFAYCTSLTSVTIGAGVTSIGYEAFSRCTSLTDITVDSDNTAYCSEDGVLFNKSKTELILYPVGNARTSYAIPDSVTSIGYDAFYDCTSLTSVTIPDSVTSIGEHAFYYCPSLTLVIIPDSVTSIGYSAFAYCDSLTAVYYCGPETMWNQLSIGSGNSPLLNAKIYYNYGVSIGDGLRWEIDPMNGSYLYIRGTGTAINNFEMGEAPWYSYRDEISSIWIFADSIEYIGEYAFYGLEKVGGIIIVSDELSYIGKYAFYGIQNINKEVTFYGTEKQWNNIDIDYGNEILLQREINCYGDKTINGKNTVNEPESPSLQFNYVTEHVTLAKEEAFTNVVDNYGFNKLAKIDKKTLVAYHIWDMIGDVGQLVTLSIDGYSFQANYYEMYLADMIMALYDQNKASEFESKIAKVYHNCFEFIEKVLKADSTFNNASNEVQKEILEALANGKTKLSKPAKDVFQKILELDYKKFMPIFDKLSTIDKVFNGVLLAVDIVNAFFKVYNAYCVTVAYSEVNNEFFTICLEAANNMTNKTYGKYFKTAVDSAKNCFTFDAIFNAAYEACKETFIITYKKIGDSILQLAVYPQVAKFLGCSAGGAAIAAYVYKGTYAILDLALDLNAGEEYKIMNFITPVEEQLLKIVQRKRNSLLKYQTEQTARSYDMAYKILRQTNVYLFETDYKYCSKIGDKNEMELATYYKNKWMNTKCHYNDYGGEYNLFSVQCPVDVYIYDENDILITSVVDEEICEYNEFVTVMLGNEQKMFIYPADKNYRLEIKARESGTMDYSVCRITNDVMHDKKVTYNIPLTENQVFTVAVSGENPAEEEFKLSTNDTTLDFDYTEMQQCETHTFGEWIVDGDSKTRFCSVCSFCEFAIDCKHSHTVEMFENVPTCTTDGNTIIICQYCNEKTGDGRIVTAHNHDYAGTIISPTCTAKGYTAYVCIYCEDTYNDDFVDNLDHIENVIPAKAATCTATGLTEGKKCTVCGAVTVEQAETPVLGHAYKGEITKEPTCTVDGVRTFTCENDANHTYTETIPALGHTEESILGKAATCTATGLTEGKKCTVCGEVLLGQTVIDKTSHKPTIVGEKAATATQDGYTGDKVCATCGMMLEEGEIIPATGEEVNRCDHLCHKDGILGFFWKIIRIFQKLFGMNPVCECGAAHY